MVQHVMARGLDGQQIFRDGKDRAAFPERAGTVIEEGAARLPGWALMGNRGILPPPYGGCQGPGR